MNRPDDELALRLAMRDAFCLANAFAMLGTTTRRERTLFLRLVVLASKTLTRNVLFCHAHVFTCLPNCHSGSSLLPEKLLGA